MRREGYSAREEAVRKDTKFRSETRGSVREAVVLSNRLRVPLPEVIIHADVEFAATLWHLSSPEELFPPIACRVSGERNGCAP